MLGATFIPLAGEVSSRPAMAAISEEPTAGAQPYGAFSGSDLFSVVSIVFESTPVLGIGLLIVGLVVPLAGLGVIVRWLSRGRSKHSGGDAPDQLAARSSMPPHEPAAMPSIEAGHQDVRSEPAERTGFARPLAAWIETIGDGAMRRHSIKRGLTRIGSADDNDILIEGAGVERYHAAIERTRELDHYLVDLTNPGSGSVRVNGKPVSRKRLRAGDRISLGASEFKFVTALGELGDTAA